MMMIEDDDGGGDSDDYGDYELVYGRRRARGGGKNGCFADGFQNSFVSCMVDNELMENCCCSRLCVSTDVKVFVAVLFCCRNRLFK